MRTRSHTALLSLAVAVWVTAAAGCTEMLGLGGDVEVRIANESGVPFDAVQVAFPEENVDYGGIPAGGASEYRRVEKAYRYAYIAVEVNGSTSVLQPIDYVGETLLSSGRYTYALTLIAPSYVSLELRRDH